MKKRLFIIVVASACLLGSVLYLKINPPLSANGITYYQDDKTKRVVQIVNSGFADITLNNVLVNGIKAKKVELATSRSNHMIAGGGLDENPHITFHKINEVKVKPELPHKDQQELYEKDDRKVIKDYGLRVWGNEVPERLKITYTYLFIPFTLEVDVTE